MKHCLFLSFLLAILHLSQAGPLRLRKRSVFYIANETACVVDDLVYTNGDPIPTEDPCESCKCRPPGFACVLQDCKVKHGCRAVRRIGQCCPDYVCGCEHNGRMYRDGEQIRDEKNPCYECHCQGSSIACAFVDCFFRVDCIPVYVPEECCPHYENCTRDVPERTSFIGDNALPPVNLLPGLYDESVLPDLPSTRVPEIIENPTDPTQPPTSEEKFEEAPAPEVEKFLDDESNKPQSTESEIAVVEEIKSSDQEIEGTTGEENQPSEKENDLPKEEITHKKEDVEEIKVLLNSESEIISEDTAKVASLTEDTSDSEKSAEKESSFSTESVPEIRDEIVLTTIANNVEIVEHVAETTEKLIEVVSESTEVPVTEKPVQNSAAVNSKSLKLNENETLEETKSTDAEAVKPQEPENNKKDDLTPISAEEEQPTKVESNDANVTDLTENKPGHEENVAEESIANPQSISFYVDDDKVIKKESAETVTIVVHVREKTKPSTETDFATEKEVTAESLTTEPTKEISLKSDLGNIEKIKESTEVAESASTGKNFEVFPSSTETNKDESSTSSPEQPEEKIKERSETDSIPIEDEKTTSKQESNMDSSEKVTIQSVSEAVTEASKEARAAEEILEIKDEELKVAEIMAEDPKIEKVEEETKITENPEEVKVTEKPEDAKVTEKPEEAKETEIKVEHPNIALKIEITNSGAQTPKIEEIEVETVKEVAEEEKKLDEKVEELKTEEKSEPKSEEILDEAKQEQKIEDSKAEEKVEELKSEEKVEELKPEEKADAIKAEEKVEELKYEEKVEESKPEEKADEIKVEEIKEKVEESKPEEIADKIKLEEKSEEIKEVNIEESNLEEKEAKAKSIENVEEPKSVETIAANSNEKPEVTEENLEEPNLESSESEKKVEDKSPEEIKELKDHETTEMPNEHEQPKDNE